jgi:hypothetical protein
MAITFRAGPAIFSLEQEELVLVEQALERSSRPALAIDPYGRTVIGSPGELHDFGAAVAEAHREYRAYRAAQLVRERGIRARTPALIEQAVGPLLIADPVLAALDRLLTFLTEVERSGAGGLTIIGD